MKFKIDEENIELTLHGDIKFFITSNLKFNKNFIVNFFEELYKKYPLKNHESHNIIIKANNNDAIYFFVTPELILNPSIDKILIMNIKIMEDICDSNLYLERDLKSQESRVKILKEISEDRSKFLQNMKNIAVNLNKGLEELKS